MMFMCVYILFTAIPVTIVPPAGSVIPNFSVGEGSGPVEVCVQAVATLGVLERAVTVILSTQNELALGNNLGQNFVGYLVKVACIVCSVI